MRALLRVSFCVETFQRPALLTEIRSAHVALQLPFSRSDLARILSSQISRSHRKNKPFWNKIAIKFTKEIQCEKKACNV